jgi:ATP-dependent protease ClpP protease subunit
MFSADWISNGPKIAVHQITLRDRSPLSRVENLLKPNPDYRANPRRAIYIQGRIDQQLVDRLTPQIMLFQAESRDPITVYIDSPGGNISSTEVLSRLLRASDQDYSPSCRLVTVATGRAASAAADLLCSGSYAMALTESVIFFHGGRRLSDDPITVTAASELMESLRLTNDRYALALADKCLPRFGFRFVSQRSKFEAHRTKVGNPTLPDLFCFLEIIGDDLTAEADKVVSRAINRNSRYLDLVQDVAKRVVSKKRFQNPKRDAEAEAEIIKAIVEYELKKNTKPRWRFSAGGLSQLNVDFLLVREYMSIYDSSHLKQLCDLFGDFLLTQRDVDEIATIIDEAERKKAKDGKVKPILRPLWLFFMALCYALQEEENELTATDAYWLGLIDEVIGRFDLQPERLTLEAEPDPSKAQTTFDLAAPQSDAKA